MTRKAPQRRSERLFYFVMCNYTTMQKNVRLARIVAAAQIFVLYTHYERSVSKIFPGLHHRQACRNADQASAARALVLCPHVFVISIKKKVHTSIHDEHDMYLILSCSLTAF